MLWNNLELPPAYYQDDAVYIIHGDCREILPLIPDKSIDLVLTDPPYGVGVDYGEFLDTQDNVNHLIQETIPLCITKSKRTVLTCGVSNMWLYPPATWVICWLNKAGANRNSWGFSCWSPVLVYGKDPYLAKGLGARADYIEHNETSPDNGHPTPKPYNFWKLLLARCSVDMDDIILDPFMGSGTTIVVAKHLNRKCIGIEIEEKYCEIAAKRCSQSVMRLEV